MMQSKVAAKDCEIVLNIAFRTYCYYTFVVVVLHGCNFHKENAGNWEVKFFEIASEKTEF